MLSTPTKEVITDEEEEPEILAESQKRDKALLYAMAGHMKKMSEQFVKFPGVTPPLEQVTSESYAYSAFVDEIARAEIPKKFFVSTIELYRGITDPVDHVSQYKQRVSILSFTSEEQSLDVVRLE